MSAGHNSEGCYPCSFLQTSSSFAFRMSSIDCDHTGSNLGDRILFVATSILSEEAPCNSFAFGCRTSDRSTCCCTLLEGGEDPCASCHIVNCTLEDTIMEEHSHLT